MWNRTEDKIENVISIFFIRHGKTPSNERHSYLGRTEEMLSAQGIKELWQKQKLGKYPKVEIVFSSPMKRCIQTANIIYPNTELILIPQWKEIDFGEFEGKNYEDLKSDDRYQEWIDSGGVLPFPEGESREKFILRCNQGLDEAKRQILLKEVKTVGAVVHGGTMMALFSRNFGGEYFDYQIENGGGYCCHLDRERLQFTNLQKI